MITIRARMGDGRISIEIAGHEEHAAGGRVCAAVSAIAQTALMGLEHYGLLYPDLVSVEITEE